MNEIISAVVFVVFLCSGAFAADRIYRAVEVAALTKAAHGLPSLTSFGHALTSYKPSGHNKRSPTHDVK